MSQKTITIAANAVVAKLIDPDAEAKALVSNALSYIVEGVEFMATTWDGRSSFFTQRTATFPAGFVHAIQSELTKAGYLVRLAKEPAPLPLGPESPIVDTFGNDDSRYDFQLKALRQVEKHGRGIIQVATGGGKSKIAKLITARYKRMTLFLTTRGVLMYQMKDAFERDCGFKVGVVGDGVWAPARGINVGMVQTLVAQLEEPVLQKEIEAIVKADVTLREKARKDGAPVPPKLSSARTIEKAQEIFERKTKIRDRSIKLLSLFEVVIGEEAHEAGGNSYYEILKHCKNAHIRVALTATPFMRDAAEDNMRLMAAFGPVLIKVSEKLLIDRGILATPYFMFRSPLPHPKLRRTSPWQRAYQLGITEGAYRNADIVTLASMGFEYGLPVMILVQRKAHGATLRKLLEAKGLSVRFIQGEDDQAGRKKGLAALESGKLDVLIGTTILDVGVDVPAVGMVILAGGGKAEVGHRQRIGRGLRAKKTGPNVAFIVDFTDEANMHLKDHARQRRGFVEATPGFAENILAPGQDFPWHLFRKRAA